MSWWRFWQPNAEARAEEVAPPPPGRPGGRAGRGSPVAKPEDDATRRRREQLRKRREMVAFDLERAESATRPDNPWQERIDLLTESIATVDADLAALAAQPPEPTFPLPETPITGIGATATEPASVGFTIGPQTFRFAEEADWDQRGGAIVRGDLRQRSGDAAALVPAGAPPEVGAALARHLVESAMVFAVDLRDRALDGEPPPERPTLADLARPCPECGGWRDWRGTCDACTRRAWHRQGLVAERTRLGKEQESEAADRRKWADRVPIARRRLADVDAELAKLETAGGR